MLFKNTLKKIKKSFGRYLSLLIIILIGIGFYSGIKSSAPDMKNVQNNYYANTNLMDFKIVSTLGLTSEDIEAIQQLNGINKVIGSYSKTVLDGENAINVHSIEDGVNGFDIIDGNMPSKADECLADSLYYHVGDVINITEAGNDKDENKNEEDSITLKIKQFKVVGIVKSPLYTGKDYGSTDIGNGKLKSYIFVPKENFESKVYTEIYVTVDKISEDVPYSKSYNNIISDVKNKINSIKEERQNARYNEIIDEANKKINDAKLELETNKQDADQKFRDAEEEIASNELKLKNGQLEINSNKQVAERKFKEAQGQIDGNKSNLIFGKEELEKQKNEFELKIKDAEYQKSQLEVSKIQVTATLEEVTKNIDDINIQLQDTNLQEEQRNELELQKIQLLATQSEIQTNLVQIDGGIKNIEDSVSSGKTQLESVEKQIADGLAQIEIAQAELNKQKELTNKQIAGAQYKINNGKKELADGKSELQKNKEEYKIKIEDAQVKINDAQSELSKIEKAKWYVLNRDDVVISYKILENQYDEVEIIANIIPLFFIIIVVLMTSNTMTRMIVEERGEMGTLSSLGVSNIKIVLNYIIYVLSSTILGAIIGYIMGTLFIPDLIFNCFPVSMPKIQYKFDLINFLIVLLVACIVMLFVTIYTCIKELKEKPAYLLRPLSPKSGKKTFIENIEAIWNHLSFSWKITVRNISRYKNRVFMTIIGAVGCTFLILIGFAIKDSINGVGEKQFTEIQKYDNMIVLNSSVESMNESLTKTLDGKVKNAVLLNQQSYKAVNRQNVNIDTYLIVPESPNEDFYNYFILRNKDTKENLILNDEGVIITTKISEKLDCNIGDEILLQDLDKNEYRTKVIGVTENYVSNYVYMSSNLYENIFGEKTTYNTIVSQNNEEQDKIANDLLSTGKILSINFSTDLLEKANNAIGGLNDIVILLVVISSLLSITVLYNLTSINISERTREIATLKVLGFKDNESNGYIYREAIITVIIGIIIGLFITPIIHGYVMDLFNIDSMVFSKQIKISSYMYAATMTFSFSIIMQIVTYFKIKAIDMIESLKSVE